MTTYKSGSDETVFDVALGRYGGVDKLAVLLADNPDLVQNDGTIDQYRVQHKVGAAVPAPTELEKAEPNRVEERVIRQNPLYKSRSTQNIFDVALMQYGGLDALALLLADNKGLIQPGGTVQQFRVEHLVRTDVAADARMKRNMLALVPCTEGAENEAWITDDGSFWITDDGQSWITDNQ